MKTLAMFFLILAALLAKSFAEKSLTAEQIEFFENKIRPVLAENCYQCHNSIDKKKGDIALDYRAALLEADIIVAGDPKASRLIGAIRHDEDYEPMPSKSPKLANIIVKNFEDWIQMGAPDPRIKKPTKEELENEIDWDHVREQRKKWWSFQAIKKSTPPTASDPEWNRNPIDQFIFAGLQANNLTPQASASPSTLVRRLHLILTGLPPKPEAVEAFVADPSEQAYEKLVDHLMASEDYGKRWARFWLDWFRYAESYGSEGDPEVPYATQYRDYVIRAINADIPYDQLVREHIAGDLLEKPRINQELGLNESAIGPAHLRMVPHGFGVTNAYDEQITFTDNQVDVVSKSILGITVSCARCHNHKFDPISQKDFYKFYGIMVSSRPAIINIDSPELQKLHRKEIPTLKQQLRGNFAKHWLSEIDSAIKNLESFKGEKLPDTNPLAAWTTLRDHQPEALKNDLRAMQRRYQEGLKQNEKAKSEATFYADLRDQATYDRWFKSGNGLSPKVSPAGSFALAPSGDRAFTGIYPAGIYSHLTTDKHSGFLNSVFHLAKGKRNAIRAVGNGSTVRFTVRSYPLNHGGLHPVPGLNPQLSWVNLNKYDYWNGEQGYYQINTGADGTFLRGEGPERSWFGVLEVYAGDSNMRELGAPIVALADDIEAIGDRDALLDFYRRSLKEAVESWGHSKLSDAQAELLNAFVSHGLLSDKLTDLPADLKSDVESYRELESAIRRPARSVGVLDGQPWDQPLLDRGDYKQEKEPVARGFLEAFPGEPYSKTNSGRRELAEDLVSGRNTLTPRVIANRLWHHTFGAGLVASTDNFGRLGKKPTHPELLDHLAIELRDNGWSMKHIVRQLVMSRTFRTGSTAPPASTETDPANRQLAYFTPRRLDAEAILDTIRFVSENSISNRAIYTRAKRNALNPFLKTFNYPIPTSTVGVRNLTNVPAQALTLLNGQITHGAAQKWSQRVKANPNYKTDAQRITAIFKQAYGRKPSTEELVACATYISGKAHDDSAELSAEHDRHAKLLAGLKQKREAIVTPVRKQLQAELDKKNSTLSPKAVDLKPLRRWNFDADNPGGKLIGNAAIEDGALVLKGGMLMSPPLKKKLEAKSLEVLVQLDPLSQSKGGAMTVQSDGGSAFDAIVYAELEAQTWMAGSEFHRRTDRFQAPPETEADKRPVRIIVVYHADGTIQGFRDGKPYGTAYKKSLLHFEAGKSHVVFGTRHGTAPSVNRALTGKIFEARLYDRALSAEEVAAASSGTLLETISEKMLLAALGKDQKEQLASLESEIAKLTLKAEQTSAQLEAHRQAIRSAGDAYFRIAHAILNSKELIYVY